MNESVELGIFTCNGTSVGQKEHLDGRRGKGVASGDWGGVSGWLCFGGKVLFCCQRTAGYAIECFEKTATNLGVVLATAPNSPNLTWPLPLGVAACVPLEGVAGSVLLALSLLERNREAMVGEEGTNKELNGL